VAGLVEPVFRLKTSDVILDTENDWTTDPTALARVFMTDKGTQIDGTHPANIEIGFHRLRTGAGV
jgi:hypothetical protein